MRYRLVATVILIGGAITLWPHSAFGQNPDYGIVTQIYPHDQRLRLVQSGAGSVRLSLDWWRAETADNFYDPTYVASIQNFLDLAAQDGLHVYLTIAYTPGWANSNAGINYPPTNIQKWREFLQDVFNVLGDRPNLTFGIWNEPDINHFLMDDSWASLWGLLWDEAVVARSNVGKPWIRLGGPDFSGDWGRAFYFSNALVRMNATASPQDVITFHYYPDHPTTIQYIVSQIEGAYPNRDIWMTEGGANQANETTQALQLDSAILNPFANRSGTSRWKKVFVYQMTDGVENYELLNAGGGNRIAIRTIRSYATGVGTEYFGVSLTADSGHYVVAEGGGGGAVKADRTAAGPWETFRLVDWNSGGLRHGDVVSFRAHNYPTSAASMRAIGGGGGSVDAAGTSWDDDAYFIFRTAGPGSIGVGDAVYLQTITGHFFVAEGGGGGIVNANRSSVGPWETFRLWQ